MIFGGVSANEASFFAFDLHKKSQNPEIPFFTIYTNFCRTYCTRFVKIFIPIDL